MEAHVRFAQLLFLFTVLTTSASAQSFEQLGFLRLNDTTPRSARTTALGGANDSLSEDVSDTAVNPATLASISKPRFAVQGVRNSVPAARYFIGSDTFPRLVSSSISRTALSQVAAAFPVGGIVIGVYYAAEPRLQGPEPLASSFGSMPYQAVNCPSPCSVLLPVRDPAFERNDRRDGAAFGWQSGAVAIGAGAEVRELDERTEINRAIFALTGTQNERLFRRTNDRAIIPNAGIRWRATPRVALAAAYNGGGSFRRTTGACLVSHFEWGTCASAVAQIGESTVRMPDAYRAGATFAVTNHLRVVGEVVRRNYSNLAEDRYTIMSTSDRFPYRDVTELHAGAEYHLSSMPVALRAGWWRDPSRYLARFVAPGETVRHYTAGAGIEIGRSRLDLAYDHASDRLQRRAVIGLAFGM
jgi:hypothetical protein